MTFRLQRPPSPSPSPSSSTPRTKPKPTKQPGPTPLTLPQKLTHLSTPLHPLLNFTTGLPHPSFPRTLLHYHLLTHAQLDELASYYHQRTPGPWMFAYPYTAGGGEERVEVGCEVQGQGQGDEGRRGGEGKALGWRREGMGLEEKRRKFGRFCGLRGCESPVSMSGSSSVSVRGEDGMEMEMAMQVDGEEGGGGEDGD